MFLFVNIYKLTLLKSSDFLQHDYMLKIWFCVILEWLQHDYNTRKENTLECANFKFKLNCMKRCEGSI
jgi:hypothetical protein